ncbi:uncharacterized protein TNCV_1876051 [Trichonephila clavipes]|nr:uncharacterized protein TNCV_1876051 [Trichonephila clavipes]
MERAVDLGCHLRLRSITTMCVTSSHFGFVLLYTKAFRDEPHNFEPWSSDKDDTYQIPLLITTPHQHEDVSALDRFNVQCSPTWRVFSGTGLELVTSQPQSDTLTARLPRPPSSFEPRLDDEDEIGAGIHLFKLSFCDSLVAAVAEWYRCRTVACLVTSSSPMPLKTRRVRQRCTLNVSRAETSSRWCSVVVRRGGASSGVVHVT